MRTSNHLYPPYYCLLPPPHLLFSRYLDCFSASHPTPLFHCIFVGSFVRPSFRPFVSFFPKSATRAWIEIVTVYRSMTGRICMPAQACSLKIACFLFSLAFLLSSLFPFFLCFSILLLNLTRYRGVKVGWKKIQRHIGHYLVLVKYISIALSHKRKKFTVQFFSNLTLKCLNVNGS